MNKIQKLAEVVQAAVDRSGIKSSSASFTMWGGKVKVHMLEEEFGEYFPTDAGVIESRPCDKYPTMQTVTSDSGVQIYCLLDAKEESA